MTDSPAVHPTSKTILMYRMVLTSIGYCSFTQQRFGECLQYMSRRLPDGTAGCPDPCHESSIPQDLETTGPILFEAVKPWDRPASSSPVGSCHLIQSTSCRSPSRADSVQSCREDDDGRR